MRRLLFILCAGLTACFSETEATADTDACAPGSAACECYGNGSCDAGLRCEASISTCIPDDCETGALGCSCDAGSCQTGLVCLPPGTCQDAPLPTSTSAGSGTSAAVTTSVATTGGPDTSASTTATTEDPGDSSTAGEPAPTPDVFVYLTRQDYDSKPSEPLNFAPSGGLNAREHANELCVLSANDFLDVVVCDTTVAVLSIDDSDSVATLGVPEGEVFAASRHNRPIAESFSAFVAEGPDGNASLGAAGIRPSDSASSFPSVFWTGSTGDGDTGETCQNWTASSGRTVGTTALMSAGGAGWIASDSNTCNARFPLLCACWLTQPR